jgi:hypothetical protein
MAALRLSEGQALRLRQAMRTGQGLAAYNRMCPDSCGVESIGLPDGCFATCRESEVEVNTRYVNRGDTYATTLMKVNGVYRVGCWGDVVEAYRKRRP